MTIAERLDLLARWNDATPAPPTLGVAAAFVEQVRRTPEGLALVFRDERLTYAELGARVFGVARQLRARGVGAEDVVGIEMPRSAEMVVAVLAVLVAGGAFVPVDPAWPELRRRQVRDEARAEVTLTAEDVRACGTGEPLATSVQGGQLAYVIFTSGSTGRPKGVEMTHRSLTNRLAWMQAEYSLTADDVVLQKTPYTFDVSVWELLWPLMYGARLAVAAPEAHRDPLALIEAIRRERVTIIHFVPSMLALFVDEPGFEECTGLRTVICSGEALPPKTVNRLTAALPAEVHNLYGPTEAAIDVTAWPCRRPEPDTGVPIGRPISNVAVYLLDGDRRLVPVGGVGEMYLGGDCLARGYSGAPALTAERFVEIDVAGRRSRVYRTGDLARWTEEGHLHYLGRTDNQVKIRGQRVELGEIEMTLQTHPSVRSAVVVLRGDTPNLIGYVVPEAGVPIEERTLRAYLRDHLPEHMVPARYVPLGQLPTTANGKVDRAALPEPPPRRRYRFKE